MEHKLYLLDIPQLHHKMSKRHRIKRIVNRFMALEYHTLAKKELILRIQELLKHIKLELKLTSIVKRVRFMTYMLLDHHKYKVAANNKIILELLKDFKQLVTSFQNPLILIT